MKISSTSLVLYLSLVERGTAATASATASPAFFESRTNGAFLKPSLQGIPRGGAALDTGAGVDTDVGNIVIQNEIDAIEEQRSHLEQRVNTAMKKLGLSFDGVNSIPRGGDASASTSASASAETESIEDKRESLEDRVHAAMKKLGLSFDGGNNIVETATTTADTDSHNNNSTSEAAVECEDGVCTLPPTDDGDDRDSSSTSNVNVNVNDSRPKEDIRTATKRIADEMQVDESIVLAAIGATLNPQTDGENDIDDSSRMNEDAAKEMIQYEVDAIQRVLGDCEEVKQLVSEGHDETLSRRALAFADMNIEVARAILLADEADAKAEEAAFIAEEKSRAEAEKMEQRKQQREEEQELKTVTVDANFDPTQPNLGAASTAAATTTAAAATTQKSAVQQPPQGAPPPAKKEDVVFQATSSNIQKVVLESPVPVLLDVYADWCGPCKALTPALEEMAVKAGGMFRLVKLNTDEERTISSALEVKSLPTVFAVKDGKIIHSFMGMPRDDKFMQNFMMGLFGAAQFNPKVTAEQQSKYDELSNKLIKVAGSAGFSFSQRERLQVRTNAKLDEIVQVRGDMASAEESAKTLRSLLSNVIRDPFDLKFRRINLENKIIAARVGAFEPAISILKSVGFASDAGSAQDVLILGKGKKIVNVAPFVVARDTIDKWIDMNRRAIATAVRKKEDEIARAKLLDEAEEVEEDEYDEEEDEQVVDPNACNLKVRLEGKNKMHDISLNADDPLSSIIDSLPMSLPDNEEIQITCAARRLIVKSSNTEAMEKSLRDHRLAPAASVVVKVMSNKVESTEESKSSLKERAAARRSRKKGEHTMQSIGIYAKDDNAKGELIDGGGGVWYEHDVSDDEEEKPAEEEEEDEKKSKDENGATDVEN